MCKPKMFSFFRSWRPTVDALTDEEAGQLLKKIFAWHDEEDLEIDRIANIAFVSIEPFFRNNKNKYNEVCEVRREAGRRGGLAKASKSKQSMANLPKKKNKKKKNNNTPYIPQGGFDVFWENYPKKVGKGAAEKSWKKIKSPSTTLSEILKALEWQKASDQWTKDNGLYIPNPATYLNQRRWEDEGQDSGTGGGIIDMPDF